MEQNALVGVLGFLGFDLRDAMHFRGGGLALQQVQRQSEFLKLKSSTAAGVPVACADPNQHNRPERQLIVDHHPSAKIPGSYSESGQTHTRQRSETTSAARQKSPAE
jgi:hypothetical protein